MILFIYTVIIILGLASYAVGIWQMIKNTYSPSMFSRVIWLLLAVNSFAGVVLSKSGTPSLVLASVLLVGNVAMCIGSFWKGTKTFGRLEYVCSGLLILSALIWIFFRAPLVNLALSLIAHCIAGIPTYKRVWFQPHSESIAYWALFFLASLLTLSISPFTSVSTILLPLYFTLFDGGMFALTLIKKPTMV